MNYPQVIGYDDLLEELEIKVFPAYVLIGPDGSIVNQFGGHDPQKLKAMIRRAKRMGK